MKQNLSFFLQSVLNRPIGLWSHSSLAVLILSMMLSILAANATEGRSNVTEGDKTTTVSSPNILKGNTEILEYNLNDIHSYREAMVQLQQRNFSGAEFLFKQAAAQLGEGHEKDRAECLYFQAGCLVMMEKKEEAISLYKVALNLFEQYDSASPYKFVAMAQISELADSKSSTDKERLYSAIATRHARISIDQHIRLVARVTGGNTTYPFLLRIERTSVPEIVHNGFAEMTCLETAEIGSNMTNAASRFRPLLVDGNPAAFSVGATYPVINVMVNEHPYKIDVKLPGLRGSRKILLVSDKEKICALDLDSHDSWLLRMERGGDGLLNSVQWVKLLHKKTNNSKANIGVPTRNRPVTGDSGFTFNGNANNRWLDSEWQSRRFTRGKSGRKAEIDSGF